MRVCHIPDGTFSRILANRRRFPSLKPGELREVAQNLGLELKPDIINLRTEPKFSELCVFLDKLCSFLEIPPVNIYWIPSYNVPKGFLTPDSGSIILAGPITNLQQIIVEALVAHEWGHGIQGDLECLAMRDSGISAHYRHMREFQSDATAAVLASWWGTFEMLKLFEQIKLGKFGAAQSQVEDDITRSLFRESSDTHPSLMSRRISSVQIILDERQRELSQDLVNQPDFCQNGVDFFTTKIDRERALELIGQAPYSREHKTKYDYNGWQFAQMKKYGIPPPEFALR